MRSKLRVARGARAPLKWTALSSPFGHRTLEECLSQAVRNVSLLLLGNYRDALNLAIGGVARGPVADAINAALEAAMARAHAEGCPAVPVPDGPDVAAWNTSGWVPTGWQGTPRFLCAHARNSRDRWRASLDALVNEVLGADGLNDVIRCAVRARESLLLSQQRDQCHARQAPDGIHVKTPALQCVLVDACGACRPVAV